MPLRRRAASSDAPPEVFNETGFERWQPEPVTGSITAHEAKEFHTIVPAFEPCSWPGCHMPGVEAITGLDGTVRHHCSIHGYTVNRLLEERLAQTRPTTKTRLVRRPR